MERAILQSSAFRRHPTPLRRHSIPLCRVPLQFRKFQEMQRTFRLATSRTESGSRSRRRRTVLVRGSWVFKELDRSPEPSRTQAG
jgi:hypothetical protein